MPPPIGSPVREFLNVCSNPVSYTHLDVYKRQLPGGEWNMLKYLRQFGIFFCSAVLIFLYPLTAPAGTAVSAPEQGRQTLRVGYINYDGFIVQENGGYIDGYGVAFLDKISEYTGWRYEFYYNTWEECLNELERGTIDLVCCAQSLSLIHI